jgi:hypothetical protein
VLLSHALFFYQIFRPALLRDFLPEFCRIFFFVNGSYSALIFGFFGSWRRGLRSHTLSLSLSLSCESLMAVVYPHTHNDDDDDDDVNHAAFSSASLQPVDKDPELNFAV